MSKPFSCFLGALVFLANVAFISGINLSIKPYDSLCVKKDLKNKEKLTGYYSISGVLDVQMEFKILDVTRLPVSEAGAVNKKNHNFEFHADRNSTWNICFISTSSSMIVVSVNFHTEAEMDRMALYEENMTLDAGAQKIKEAYMNIETLISTQETLQVRETIHNNIIRNAEEKIKKCSVVKIVIVIAIAITQIFVLTRFFPEHDFNKLGV